MAYRSSTYLNGATSTAANFSVPSGAATGDIAIVAIYSESSGTITPPSGFTQTYDSGVVAVYRLAVFWKRLTAADTGTYNFTTSTSAWREGTCSLYSGRISSGDPFTAWSNATPTSATSIVTPAITAATNDDLVGVATCFNGGSWTAPSGMTERQDTGAEMTLDTQDAVTAGSTGTKTFTYSGGASGMKGFLGALAVAGGGATSVTPDSATHAHTATSPVLTQHNALTPSSASHAHSATSPTLTQHNTVSPDSAAHAHSATTPTLTQHNVIAPANGAHAHTATSPSLTQHNVIAPDNATHGHTSTQPTLSVGGQLSVASASHAHTATSPTLTQHNSLTPNNSTLAHTATSPTLAVKYTVTPANSSHVHTASSPTLTPQTGLSVASALHAHTATSPTLVQHSVLVVASAVHAHTATSPVLHDNSIPDLPTRGVSITVTATVRGLDIDAPTRRLEVDS